MVMAKGKELFLVGIANGPAIWVHADECVAKHSTQTVELKTGEVVVGIFPKESMLYVVAKSAIGDPPKDSSS